MTVQVAVVNASSVISDTDAAHVVAALQVQTTQDFAPIWGTYASLTFVPKGHTAPPAAWQMVILDNSDQAGALGYHDITQTGQPLGKVFAADDKRYKLSWSVTASHELFEMLVDPWVNLTVFNQTGDTKGRLYAYEVCDACEDDKYGYQINGVLVSDFVYPSWFEGWRSKGSTQFDHQKHITAPFELLTGGYIGYFDVGSGTGWQQQTAAMAPGHEMKARATVGSRRERRTTGPDRWVTSTI